MPSVLVMVSHRHSPCFSKGIRELAVRWQAKRSTPAACIKQPALAAKNALQHAT